MMFGCIEIGSTTNAVGQKCSDGFYLYTNTTLSDISEIVTACVPDGSMVDPRLINNPKTRQGESGGDACLAGSSIYGGESGKGSDDSSSIINYLTSNPTGMSTDFATCIRGYSLNNAGETCSSISEEIVCTDCIQPVNSSSGASGNQNSTGDAFGDNTCESGTSGYYLESDSSCQSGLAFENGAKGDSTQCFQGSSGYSQLKSTSGGSLNGYAESYYQGDCAQGEDTTSDGIFDTCIRGNKDLVYQPYSTTISNTSCVTSCNKDQYISYELISDEYGSIYDQRTGVNGDSHNCYEGVGSNSDQCKSGQNGYYLSLNQVGGVIGTGVQITNSSVTLDLFVTAGEEQDSADGSYELPYGHIAKALEASDELSAEYADAIVNIYLLNGDHYMTRNLDHFHYSFR